jgi:hypothetical protein
MKNTNTVSKCIRIFKMIDNVFKLYFKYGLFININKNIIVEIDSIKFQVSDDYFKKIKTNQIGQVIDNNIYDNIRDFDLDREFVYNEKYLSIFQHFKQQIMWSETPLFYNRYKNIKFKNNTKFKGCSDLSELEKHYIKTYDNMYNQFCNNKFKVGSFFNNISPIYVIVLKNGEFCFTPGGNHRLALLKLAGYEFIPVKVFARHKNWVKFLKHNKKSSPISRLKYPKSIFLHPDL